MSKYEPTKQHLREAMLLYFNQKKSAAECHRLLSETYPEHSISNSVCKKWFARFKSGDFDVEDKERPGQMKKFEDEELKALLEEDPCNTQKDYAELLGVTQQAISKRKDGHNSNKDTTKLFCSMTMLGHMLQNR